MCMNSIVKPQWLLWYSFSTSQYTFQSSPTISFHIPCKNIGCARQAVMKTRINQEHILPFLLDLCGSIISLYCNSETSTITQLECTKHRREVQSQQTAHGLTCSDGAKTDDCRASWWVVRHRYVEQLAACSEKVTQDLCPPPTELPSKPWSCYATTIPGLSVSLCQCAIVT